MTAEARAVAEALGSAERVAARLRRSVAELSSRLPAGSSIPSVDDAFEKDIDAFLKRWEQLQDLLANRFARSILVFVAADVSGWTSREAFSELESIGALAGADRFFEISRLRNRLIHEYPMDDERRWSRIDMAWAFAPALLEEHDRMAAYARRLLADGDQP